MQIETAGTTLNAVDRLDTARQSAALGPGAAQAGPQQSLAVSHDQTDDSEKVLKSFGEALKQANITLKFSRDEDTGMVVIKMIDQTSGETVTQIPSQAVLQISAYLGKMQGLVFSHKA